VLTILFQSGYELVHVRQRPVYLEKLLVKFVLAGTAVEEVKKGKQLLSKL
jgi:hypothetical protein